MVFAFIIVRVSNRVLAVHLCTCNFLPLNVYKTKTSIDIRLNIILCRLIDICSLNIITQWP